MLKINPQTLHQIHITKPTVKNTAHYSKERINTLQKFVLRNQIENSIYKNNFFKKRFLEFNKNESKSSFNEIYIKNYIFSSSKRYAFLSIPPAYPVRLPLVPTTLWHGMIMEIGLCPTAWPTACDDILFSPRCEAIFCAI